MLDLGVRVQLLGPIRAWCGDEEVALRGVSARTVLARLALASGSVVSNGALGDSLWGEDLPVNPTANLQTVVSRLRRGLGSDAIESVPGGYRLSDRVAVDVDRLRSCLEAVDERDPAVAREELGRLVADIEGPSLGGSAPTIELEPERMLLEELVLLARDTTVRVGLAAGDPEIVILDARRNAEAAPLREQTQQLAAEALARLDRRAEALRVLSRYRATLREETGLDVSESTLALERAVLDGSVGVAPAQPEAARRRSASIPWIPPDTPFEGRASELAELAALTGRARLVNVVGAGGVGKTRLVMEHLCAHDDADVVVVELATLAPGSSIASSVGRALGLEPGQTDVQHAIAQRLLIAPTRLVLDNCEHVLASCAGLVRELLRAVEHLQILATSRRRIGLPEEQVLRIAPLAVESADGVAPGARVFADRVARCSLDAAPTYEDGPLVAEITQLLDGLPLALEVAAPRAHLLGLEGLRDQLRARQSSGVGGGGLIAGTVRWSTDLLTDDAATLFHEVCVFPGRFGLEAVEAVSSLPAPLDALGELVEASLVTVDSGGSRRFRLLEPVREVGAQGVPAAATMAFAEWVLDLGEVIAREWHADHPSHVHGLLADHRYDLRLGFSVLRDASRARDAERLASRIATPLVLRADLELFEAILAAAPQHPEGRCAHATLEWAIGRASESVATAVELLQELDPDDPLVPLLLCGVAPACSFTGDLERMVDFGARLRHHPAAGPADRVYGASFEALARRYLGDVVSATTILDETAEPGSSDAGGFVAFVRAEIAAATDTDAAREWLEVGAQQADAAGSFMIRRMIDVARLALFMNTGNFDAARPLVRSVVDDLLVAGLIPQGWMTIRHAATLLAASGQPDLALLVLDSANASPQAPALHGDAAQADAELRAQLSAKLAEHGVEGPACRAPQSFGELWPAVAAALTTPTPG